MAEKILLTGMTGFAGGWLAEEILARTDWEIFSLERITARENNLGALTHSPRIHRIYHDFRAAFPQRIVDELQGVDKIVHIGAEVHGLRSLENPELFVHSNVMGTFHLLELARQVKPGKFIYISSAEAVGSAPAIGSWAEDCTLNPSNPYAAAKAAGEVLTQSYHKSFGVPAMIVRTMNIFGERQDISKFIPGVIKKILSCEVVTLHVAPDGKSGSRHWLHVLEFVNALFYLLDSGLAGETYHVIGPECTNKFIIEYIGAALDVRYQMVSTVPGKSHDMRYSIADTKLPAQAYSSFLDSMQEALVTTVREYKKHREWLQ
jgi:dTDP-glucose 4,6-dehydratase